MPRSGNGQYTLPVGNPVVSNTPIEAAWANSTLNDIAQALTNSLATDGQTAPTANLPMAGFRHTTVGAATTLSQYARADQVQTGELLVMLGATMAVQDVYAAVLPLAATTFTQWQIVFFACPASNTGAATLNVNATGPKAVLHADGTPTVVGDFVAGVLYGLTWDGNAWRFLNASSDYTALDARYIQKSGGTMSGALQVIAPAGNNDATPKIYVDTGLNAKLNLAGGTLTGALTLAGDPVAPLQAATRQYVLAAIAGATAGVSSFNTRQGAVTLLSADVTTALTFTPYSASNPSGFINGITGPQVVAALGYTPFNAAGGTITGPLSVTGKVTSPGFTQTQFNGTIAGNSVVFDYASGQVQYLGITAQVNNPTLANLPIGASLNLILYANPNSVVLGWPAEIVWRGGSPPVLNTGAIDTTDITLRRVAAGIVLGQFTYF